MLNKDKYLILYVIGLSHMSKCRTTPKQSTLFHLFLSSSGRWARMGGCGKSHLIETVFHTVRYFCMEVVTQLKFYLLLALTGVAAININGNAVHSGLHIPCQGKLLPLNDAKIAELRNKYSEVELVIIDKISMVSSKLFYQTHKCLNEIFSPGQDIPFGRKSILVCGDVC